MIENNHNRARAAATEYRFFWLVSFLVLVIAITAVRLFPTSWSKWRRDKNIFTVIREARELTDSAVPMAFMAF